MKRSQRVTRTAVDVPVTSKMILKFWYILQSSVLISFCWKAFFAHLECENSSKRVHWVVLTLFHFYPRSLNWTQMPKLLCQASALQGQPHQWYKALSTCMRVHHQQPLSKGCPSSTCNSNQGSLLNSYSTRVLWQQRLQLLLVLYPTCNNQEDLSQDFLELACHRSYQGSPVWRCQLTLSSRCFSFHGYSFCSPGLPIWNISSKSGKGF